MIGLIVATHSDFSKGILRAAEMIVGPAPLADAISINKEDDVDQIRTLIGEMISKNNRDGDGILIMTDMFGGTPANLAISFLEPGYIEVLTGVNLPMILKFFAVRDTMSVVDLGPFLCEYARNNISLPSEILKR